MTSVTPSTGAAAPSRTRPLTIIRPHAGWLGIGFGDVWRYRDLLAVLARREITLRYRQTFLGVIWVVLQPLIAAVIFSFVFGRIAGLPSDGVPYFVFSFAGFLGWTAFQGTLLRVSGTLVQNSQLVSKVYFPRLVLPLSALGLTALDFLVGAALLVVILPLYHVRPTLALLTLPFWFAALALLALGIGLYFAALVVRYRDVQHALPIFLQFALYATPIAFATSAVPASLAPFVRLNPLVGVLEGFRWAIVGTRFPRAGDVLYSLAFVVVALLAGVLAFRRLEREFADVV